MEQTLLTFQLDAPEIKLPNFNYTSMEEDGSETKPNLPFQSGLVHEINIGLGDERLGDEKWFEDKEG